MAVFEDDPAALVDNGLDVTLHICLAHWLRPDGGVGLVPLLDAAFDVHAGRSHDQHWLAGGVVDERGVVTEVNVFQAHSVHV